MTTDDYPAWIRMRHDLWPDCPLERHRLEVEHVLQGDGVVFLAENRDRGAIGFAEISIRRDHVEGTASAPVPYLEGWYVVQDYRGQGVGRALVDGSAAWAMENGFIELASDAELTNTESIRAHERLGFKEVGRTVHFVRQLKASRSERRAS